MGTATATTYIQVNITNNSNIKDTDLFIFLQSQTQIYSISTSTRIASVFTPTGTGTKTVISSAPSIALSDLKNGSTYTLLINQADDLKSGRLYFSNSSDAVQITTTGSNLDSINGSSPMADFIFDFVELTIKGNTEVNLDTTQIDQFGMPITVQVTPSDANFPNGTGIVSGTNRSTVISNFTTLCTNAAFAPYSECVRPIAARAAVPKSKTTPAKAALPASHRMIGPQHLIDTLIVPNQFKGDISSATSGTPNTATFTLTTPNQTFGAITGWVVAGPGVPPGTTVSTVSATQITMESTLGTFDNMSGANLWFYEKPSASIISSMDDAIYEMFEYYKKHTLYLVANGTKSGMEIYAGKVITNFTLPAGLTDINGKTGTEYTVFEFTGTGYRYDDASNKLTAVPAKGTGETNVYQVFYPYFSTNCKASPHSKALPPAPPAWFKAGWGANIPATKTTGPLGDINIVSPASQMALGCAGTFADSAYQSWAYHASTSNKLQDDTILGNIENQLVTMLNRGISPNTGSGNSNLHIRLGYITSNGLKPIDLSKLTTFAATTAVAPTSSPGAMTNFVLKNPTGTGIPIQSISGKLYMSKTEIQSFTIDTAGKPTFSNTGSPSNTATGIDFNASTSELTFNWVSAVGLSGVTAEISFSYGPILSENYATLKLIDPNGNNKNKTFTDDIGTDSTNLVAGMQMTTTSEFSQPMEIYFVDADGSSVILHSPMPFQPFNAGLLLFSNFYPMLGATPEGAWNTYSYYFHNGNAGQNIPTIDGRGYAFPFDDNGGYSSDLDVTMTASTAVSIDVTLNETV